MQFTPLSTLEMRVLELNAEYLGVNLGTLMENAGKEVSRVVLSNDDVTGKRVGVICGTGGNGGDGFVASRYLQESGASVEVFLVGAPEKISSPHTLKNWELLQNLETIPVAILRSEYDVRKSDIMKHDILIDGLLGFGLASDVREPTASAIRLINKCDAVKYSIDIPSGMNSDTGSILGVAVKADHTVTMHAPKPGLIHNPEYVGQLHVAFIGIPPEAYHICGTGDLWLFNRPRQSDAHKGEFGRILVVGGSDVYSGAPALAGMAALRAGADLVSVIAPAPVAPAIRCYSPNLMVKSTGTEVFDETCVQMVVDAALENDVIAIGPGLGTAIESQEFFTDLLEIVVEKGKQLVIDADGLKSLAKRRIRLDFERSILTPHWGEMQLLLGKKLKSTTGLEEKLEYARETAESYNATVLLKGPVDIIICPNSRYKYNRTGHPAMTVGGTGDVLTGISAAFLARKHGAYHAASAAAFVSGIAGELAAKDLGGRILATDCIEKIPFAMM